MWPALTSALLTAGDPPSRLPAQRPHAGSTQRCCHLLPLLDASQPDVAAPLGALLPPPSGACRACGALLAAAAPADHIDHRPIFLFEFCAVCIGNWYHYEGVPLYTVRVFNRASPRCTLRKVNVRLGLENSTVFISRSNYTVDSSGESRAAQDVKCPNGGWVGFVGILPIGTLDSR